MLQEVRRATSGRLRGLAIDDAGDRWIIRGCAPSYYVKQLAIEAVKLLTAHDGPAIVLEISVSP